MKLIIVLLAIVVLFVHTESKILLETDSQTSAKMQLNTKSDKVKINERPIIGIWTQPRNNTYDYIVAAYVKFAEMGGARVIPLMYNDTDENLIDLASQINGVIQLLSFNLKI